jgi:hypothetical protein
LVLVVEEERYVCTIRVDIDAVAVLKSSLDGIKVHERALHELNLRISLGQFAYIVRVGVAS